MAVLSDLEDYGKSVASDVNQTINDVKGDFNEVLQSLGTGFDTFSSIPISEDQTQPVNYKVRLVSVLGLSTAFRSDDIGSVVFDVTPTFSENGNVSYNPVQPVHMPGGIQNYRSTDSRTFSIGATLISRNVADVQKNMRYLQTLRSWRYPFFGKSDVGQSNNAVNRIQNDKSSNPRLLGAPPEVLFLYAYSTSNNDSRQFADGNTRVNINRVPVVLTTLSIDYPNDVDYLPSSLNPTKNTEPFPVRIGVSIGLTEAHSPVEYERFDLMAYKTGNLINF